MMFLQTHSRRAPGRGFSLIELLVVAALLVALGGGLAYFYLGGKSGKPGERRVTPLSKAHDTECLSNIRSVRQSIAAAHAGDADEKYPASLAELRELPRELRACPVGKEPYVYDPSTGEVHCPHPGHENY
jgi:prepilin-type N-terminal cleavage/methylation domain-containing protein